MFKKIAGRDLACAARLFQSGDFFLPFLIVAVRGRYCPTRPGSVDTRRFRRHAEPVAPAIRRAGSWGGTTDLTGNGQGNIIIQAQPALSGPPLPASRLEQIMSARAGARLEQFGYDQLGRGRTVSMAQTGAVADDYVLGPAIKSSFPCAARKTANCAPRSIATGRSCCRVLAHCRDRPHLWQLPPGSGSGGPSRLCRNRCICFGEPGASDQRAGFGRSQCAGPANSDRPVVGGGCDTGIRRRQEDRFAAQCPDSARRKGIYGRSLQCADRRGTAPNLRLADGDRIIVPPLGRTVAVTGLVRQPGIFELAAGQSAMPVRTLLALAGGQEVRGPIGFRSCASMRKAIPIWRLWRAKPGRYATARFCSFSWGRIRPPARPPCPAARVLPAPIRLRRPRNCRTC